MMDAVSTTDVIRLRRSRIYDAVFLLVVIAIVLLVTIPALVPLVQAFKGNCAGPVTAPMVPKK